MPENDLFTRLFSFALIREFQCKGKFDKWVFCKQCPYREKCASDPITGRMSQLEEDTV